MGGDLCSAHRAAALMPVYLSESTRTSSGIPSPSTCWQCLSNGGFTKRRSPAPWRSYRQLLGDPLQQVQRLLGHASLTTTSSTWTTLRCAPIRLTPRSRSCSHSCPMGHRRDRPSPKGSRVRFGPDDGASPPAPDDIAGLRFTIEARYGGSVLVDLPNFSPALAIAFAGALRREAGLGGYPRCSGTIKQHVYLPSVFHLSRRARVRRWRPGRPQSRSHRWL